MPRKFGDGAGAFVATARRRTVESPEETKVWPAANRRWRSVWKL